MADHRMVQPPSRAAFPGRALALLAARPARPDLTHGYLDLMDLQWAAPGGPAQALMRNSVVAAVYERWWRPALGRIAKGLRGPSMADEFGLARDLLALGKGDMVLDVACGPGNFTRDLAAAVGETGLVVGIDASRVMLDHAVRETGAAHVGYIRGDAVDLPFRDSSFDAVCCFAALHLFDEPFRALDHMTRVLRPGGRIALLTSHRHRSGPLRVLDTAVGAGSGMRMFDHEEITDALNERGFDEVRRHIAGVTQFVGGRRRPGT